MADDPLDPVTERDDSMPNGFAAFAAPPMASVDEAVQVMTSFIPQELNGARVTRTEQAPKHLMDKTWYPLTDSRDNRGRYAVTYTFDMAAPLDPKNAGWISNPHPLDEKERERMRRVFANYENVANIKFYEAGKHNMDYPGMARLAPHEARLAVFASDNIKDPDQPDSDITGLAGGMETPDGRRYVYLKSDIGMEPATMSHEIAHACAALGHSGGNGQYFDYPFGASVMHAFGLSSIDPPLGGYDIASLQKIFGKSTHALVREPRVTVDELLLRDTLHRDVPVTVDLSGMRAGNYITVDLARECGAQIEGFIVSESGREGTVNVSASLPTVIADVNAADKDATFWMRGGAIPNRLTGGRNNDLISAYGGDDVLTGGKGGDTFRFDAKSGTGNIIPDFTPGTGQELSDDGIVFDIAGVEKIRLSLSAAPFNGKHVPGTKIEAINAAGKTLAAVIALGYKPEAIPAASIQCTHERQEEWWATGVDMDQVPFETIPVSPAPAANNKGPVQPAAGRK